MHVASDNYGAGVLCAEHLMNTCDSAKVVLIEHASTKSGMDRIQGFCDTLASHPDFQIIGRADSAVSLKSPCRRWTGCSSRASCRTR